MESHPHAHPVPRWHFAVIIALMSALAPFSIDTYLPSFPDIGRELGASALEVQQTLSVYLVAFGLMMLAHGPLSDAWGRKPVVLAALLAYIATSVGCAFVDSIESLIVVRAGQGLAAGAGMVIGRAMIRDVYSGAQAQRLMANVMMIFALAPAVAPILGGWLHEFAGWRSVFWFLAALSLAIFVLAYAWLPETLPRVGRQSAHPQAIARTYVHVLRHRRFLLLAAVMTLNFGGLFLYVASTPVLIIDDLGFAPGDFGWFFVPVVLGIMAGTFLSGRLAGRFSFDRTLIMGMGVMGAAALVNLLQATLLPTTPFFAIAPVAVYSAGMSFAAPVIGLAVLDTFPQNRGLVSAVQGMLQTLANAAIAGALAPLLSHRVLALATGMLTLLAASFMIWRLALVPSREVVHGHRS